MKATINEDGLTVTLESGEIKKINNLIILKEEKRVLYEPTDNFFKLACPTGTKHTVEFLSDGKVNLF